MNIKFNYWLCIICFITIDSVFSSTLRYDYNSNKVSNHGKHLEKRNAVLIALGAIAVGMSIYQKVSKCKNEAPTLSDNVKKYEELQAKFESLRSQINLEWNDVVDVRGYVKRIETSSKVFAEQLSEFFNDQYTILSALDPDFEERIDQANKELKEKYGNSLEIPYKDVELEYHSAIGFSLKLLTTSMEMTGTSVHVISHQMQHALTHAYAPYLKSPGLMVVRGDVSLSKVKDIFGKSTLSQQKLSLEHNLAKTKFVTNAVSGILIIATAANVAWQWLSYEKKCKEYEEKAATAVKKITEAVNDLEQIQKDVTEVEQNATLVYNDYVSNLNDDQLKESINSIITYVSGSGIAELSKTSILNTLNNYVATIGSSTKSMSDREGLLNDLTSNAMTKILQDTKCVGEQLKVVSSMRYSCGSGSSTLNELYTSAKNTYDSLSYKCHEVKPLNKDTVINAVKENLALFNMSYDCALNKAGISTLVCGKIRESEESIASELNIDLTAVEAILKGCSKVSVPLPSGESEICAEKSSKSSIVDVKTKFSFWIETEVESIYNACSLDENQKLIICNDKYNLISVGNILTKFGNYDSTKVMSVFNNCAVLTSVSKSDETVICLLKKSNVAIDDADFNKLREKYTGSTLLQDTYDIC